MNVFDSSLPLLISLFLQLIIVPTQLIHYIARRSDTTRLRYLWLLLLFIGINTISLFDESLFLKPFVNNSFAMVMLKVIAPMLFVRYYISSELGFSGTKRNSISLLISSIMLILSYELLSKFANFDTVSYSWTYIIPLEFFLLFFNIRVLYQIIRSRSANSSIYFTSIASLMCLILLPAILTAFHSEWLESFAFNTAFFLMSYTYFIQFYQTAKSETEFLEKLNLNNAESLIENYHLSNVLSYTASLTPREVEITQHLISGMSYQEIGDKLFMTPSGVRKHASNIFSKLDVSNLVEFRKKYSSLKDVLND